MRWSKIKNIIILLLLAVNVCLLGMVGLRTIKTGQLERETRRQMVAVLERSGVEFLPEELPGAMELSGTQVTLLQPTREQAALILGDIKEEVHTAGAASYVGTNGGITFTGTGVDARLLPEALPLEGKDAADSGRALLESLGLAVSRPRTRQLTTGVELTYTQLWQGSPVPEMSLSLTYLEGSLRRITGHWLLAEAVPLEGTEEKLDGPTALARFLEVRNRDGYVSSQIRAMYPGYLLVTDTTADTLRPAWFVETDTWPWRFAVDCWTGDVRTGR